MNISFLFWNERGSKPKEEQSRRNQMRTTNSHNISKKQQSRTHYACKTNKQNQELNNLVEVLANHGGFFSF